MISHSVRAPLLQNGGQVLLRARMRFKSIVLFVLGLLLFFAPVRASHILGGEFRLAPTGVANRYTLSMLVFWDEPQLTFANKDPYVDDVLIFRKRDNRLMKSIRLPLVSERQISYPNQGCAGSLIKTLEGTFSSDIELNPGDYNDPDGYYIVYERCCRSASVSNISEPESTGLVFYLEFPAISIQNTSPVFNSANGDYICRGLPYRMNVGATDADGDMLRYSIVAPTRGNTTLAEPRGNALPKAGYPLVQLAPGISTQNLIPGNPALSIDPITGVVTVVASDLGLFVFTVQVEEFRNGKRIGLTRRDFQSLVVECQPQMLPAPTILYNKKPVPNIQQCDSSTVTLEVDDAGNYAYQWQFNTQDIAGATDASFLASKDGAYTVRRSLKTPGNCSQLAQSPIVYLVQGRTPDATIRRTSAAICEGRKIDLVAERNEDYAYEWRRDGVLLPEKSSILAVSEAGNYRLNISNNANGCVASDTIRVASESVSLQLPAQVSFPRGGSVVLKPEAFSSLLPVTYRWSPPTGLSDSTIANPMASPDQNTVYTLQIKTPGGCLAAAAIEVVVIECTPIMPPKPNIVVRGVPVGAILYACGDELLVFEVSANANYTYQWQHNGLDIPGATSPAIAVSDSGNYSVVVDFKSTDPCKSSIMSAVVNVIRVHKPEAGIMLSSDRICSGGSVTLTAAAGSELTFQWISPDLNAIGNGPEISVGARGQYLLNVTDPVTGCANTDSTLLTQETLVLKLPAEALIQNGQSTQLRPLVETNAVTVAFVWSPPTGLDNPTDASPVASPEKNTTYKLKVNTPAGCTAEDSIRVLVIDQLYIPDAFSPNDDGINDNMIIQNGEELIRSVRIYDRWGEVVFNEDGYAVPWDGRLHNQRVPNGAYAYLIVTDKSTYKGTIMIIY